VFSISQLETLLHSLSILGADGPKDLSGGAVYDFKALGQQLSVTVVKLAIGKSGLAFESKRFADHKSGGLGFLLMNSAGNKRATLDCIQHLACYFAQ
jgi:hypothetical protein